MAKRTRPTTEVDPSMRIVGKPRSSVRDLIREISDQSTFQEFEKSRAERGLVRALTVMRTVKGMSQVELAEKMGCTQSKVSKLESSVDADLSLGDITLYATALGVSLSVKFAAAEEAATQEIGVKPAGIAKPARKARKRSATSG